MKTALIHRKDIDVPDYHVYMIENNEDLKEFSNFIKKQGVRVTEEVLRSSMDIRKFDHMIPSRERGGIKSSLMSMALHRSRSNRFKDDMSIAEADEDFSSIWNNPLYQIMPSAMEFIHIYEKALRRGDILLINKNGGYMNYIPSMVDIVEVTDSEIETGDPKSIIRNNTQYIVLENDVVLPKDSAEFLHKKDKNFSIIFDLRSNMNKLDTMFGQFKKNGGHTVFVYTTGLDVVQMEQYTKSIIKNGLKKLVFFFVGGVGTDIKRYLDFYKPQLDITVLDELK